MERATFAADVLLPRASDSSNDNCVECPPTSQLQCPNSCPSGTQCQFVFPTSCQQCASSICAPIASSSPTPSGGSSPNVGAIAGGVIGGLVVIAVATYLVWRFCIKTRRRSHDTPVWAEEESRRTTKQEFDMDNGPNRQSSIRTRHSVASTVLTRASNIIQIAYIPGVTNRAQPTSPTLLVPPVPPIPMAVSQASTPSAVDEQHFFMPGDLRDSTYSGISGFTDRTSYARTSYAPRSSVASTIYGKNAVIVAPAQTGMRAKPAMVSVKSTSSGGSNGGLTPPVPIVDFERFRPNSPAGSTFSVGSTFLNNANAATAMPARAQVVRVGSGGKKPETRTSQEEPQSPKSPKSVKSATSPTRQSSVLNGTIIEEDTPVVDQGPFVDPPDSPRTSSGHRSNQSLSAMIEEATRRASRRQSGVPLQGRESSPFGDEHATQE
jgi:protein OPY2